MCLLVYDLFLLMITCQLTLLHLRSCLNNADHMMLILLTRSNSHTYVRVTQRTGYMISLFYSICAYIYFLGTKGSQFDLGPFTEYWSKYFLDSKKAKVEFDQERWDFLVRVLVLSVCHCGV